MRAEIQSSQKMIIHATHISMGLCWPNNVHICEATLSQSCIHIWSMLVQPCTHTHVCWPSYVHICEAMLTSHAHICEVVLAQPCSSMSTESTLSQALHPSSPAQLQSWQYRVHYIILMKNGKQVTVSKQQKWSQGCWLTALTPSPTLRREDYKLEGCWATNWDLCVKGRKKRGKRGRKEKCCEICVSLGTGVV